MNLKIGNTPLIKIKYKYKGKENYIYTKLESYNITGSIKDRVAYYIIKEAYKDIRILRAFVLGGVLGLLFGLLGLLIYLVADDRIYLPGTLAYRYGETVAGCIFEGKEGYTLQPGVKGNVRELLRGAADVAMTAVDAELSLPQIADLFEENFICVPSLCQVPEAVEAMKQMDGVLLIVSAGETPDKKLQYVLDQMRLHNLSVKGMLLVGADKKLLKRYGLPVKGE